MRYHKIPDETVRRLPIYLRGLLFLHDQNQPNVSSSELAEVTHLKSPLIRKDFSYFGEFGTSGVGYNIERLVKEIRKILKLNVSHKVALIGAGNLGSAILKYAGFKRYGFEIVAIFDNSAKKVGRKIENLKIENISKIKSIKKRKIDIAILAVPGPAADDVVDELVKAGVNGILNFTPRYLDVPKKVKVKSVDIAMDLLCLPYYQPTS